MIRVSALMVAVAIAVLVAGVAASSLLLVYVSIAACAIAMLFLAVGVLRHRGEIFGDAEGLTGAQLAVGAGLASAGVGSPQEAVWPAMAGPARSGAPPPEQTGDEQAQGQGVAPGPASSPVPEGREDRRADAPENRSGSAADRERPVARPPEWSRAPGRSSGHRPPGGKPSWRPGDRAGAEPGDAPSQDAPAAETSATDPPLTSAGRADQAGSVPADDLWHRVNEEVDSGANRARPGWIRTGPAAAVPPEAPDETGDWPPAASWRRSAEPEPASTGWPSTEHSDTGGRPSFGEASTGWPSTGHSDTGGRPSFGEASTGWPSTGEAGPDQASATQNRTGQDSPGQTRWDTGVVPERSVWEPLSRQPAVPEPTRADWRHLTDQPASEDRSPSAGVEPSGSADGPGPPTDVAAAGLADEAREPAVTDEAEPADDAMASKTVIAGPAGPGPRDAGLAGQPGAPAREDHEPGEDEFSGPGSWAGEPASAPPTGSARDDAGPAGAESADAALADSGPADSGPADSGPAAAEPGDAELADSGPAAAEPGDAELADAGPADAELADSGLADAELADAGHADAAWRTPGLRRPSWPVPRTATLSWPVAGDGDATWTDAGAEDGAAAAASVLDEAEPDNASPGGASPSDSTAGDAEPGDRAPEDREPAGGPGPAGFDTVVAKPVAPPEPGPSSRGRADIPRTVVADLPAVAPGRDAQDAAEPAAQPAPAEVSARIEVTVVPGVSRYHRSECILTRFMGPDDLEIISRQEAEEAGFVPCRACQPDTLTP